jgi:Fe-S cluster assembly protein SufD
MEAWKYMPLEELLATAYRPAAEGCLESTDLKKVELFFIGQRPSPNRLVFVNGHFSAKYSRAAALPAGARLENLADALRRDSEPLREVLAPETVDGDDAFSAVNALRFRDGAALVVPDGARMEEPIHLLFLNVGECGAAIALYPRVALALGRGARASVVVDHAAIGAEPFLSDAVLEARLSPDAWLDIVEVRRAKAPGHHFTNARYTLGRGSRLEALSFTSGGRVTRGQTLLRFVGEHASASVKGLAVLEGVSESHEHVTAEHAVPHGTSRQFFKNVLAGRARAEFDSLVHVHPGAFKSDSQQLSRALLLSDEAQAWARPQLRILADDVSCAHGAAIGRLEKEELFYLRSRGLSLAQARFLLTYGFAEEILEDLPDDGIRPALESLVRETVGRSAGGSP